MPRTHFRPHAVAALGETVLSAPRGLVTAFRVEEAGSRDWKLRLADADGSTLSTILGGIAGRSVSIMASFTGSLRIESTGAWAGRVRLDIEEGDE